MSDLIERFRRLAEGRSKMRGQHDVIYEIHVGAPGHAWIASSDLIAAADEITALRERVAVLTGLIRECRLADASAARTGDESRWNRAFDALCRAEKQP